MLEAGPRQVDVADQQFVSTGNVLQLRHQNQVPDFKPVSQSFLLLVTERTLLQRQSFTPHLKGFVKIVKIRENQRNASNLWPTVRKRTWMSSIARSAS